MAATAGWTPRVDPVGLTITEAVYAPGDPHCCPSSVRTTTLVYTDGRWQRGRRPPRRPPERCVSGCAASIRPWRASSWRAGRPSTARRSTRTLAPAEGSVDDTVETTSWAPRDGVDDGIEQVAFVDGVRRIDARLTIDDPTDGPVPGLCGTFAVGAVRWEPRRGPSEVADERVERWAVLAGGRAEIFPVVDLQPPYETITIPDHDGDALVNACRRRMRAAEGHLAARVADRRVRVRRRTAQRARPAAGRRHDQEPPRHLPGARARRDRRGPGGRPTHAVVHDRRLPAVLLVRAARGPGRRPLVDGHRAVRGLGAPAPRRRSS